MSTYGNILTLFNATEDQKKQVATKLTELDVEFEIKDNVVFVETYSKDNTTEIIEEVRSIGAPFIFFHNKNSDGSYIKVHNISAEQEARVNEILFL